MVMAGLCGGTALMSRQLSRGGGSGLEHAEAGGQVSPSAARRRSWVGRAASAALKGVRTALSHYGGTTLLGCVLLLYLLGITSHWLGVSSHTMSDQ